MTSQYEFASQLTGFPDDIRCATRPCLFPVSDARLTNQQLAELHVHLEGTIRRETAVALSAQNRLPAPPGYEYSDLPGFLAIYGQVSQCMVTKARVSSHGLYSSTASR